MLVSHDYEFIFLRTEKTAGTSLKQALSEVSGDISGSAVMSRPKWAKYSPIHHGALMRHLPQYFGLHTHATAAQARRVLGARVFDRYFKFAIERNPWERQVSLYTHRQWKKGLGPESFDRDMQSFVYRNTEYCRLNNWKIYTIDDEIVVDQLVRYEDLDAQIQAVLGRLGVPDLPPTPRRRAYVDDRPHYSTFYSPATRDLVHGWYRREIDALGYVFDDVAQADHAYEPDLTDPCGVVGAAGVDGVS